MSALLQANIEAVRHSGLFRSAWYLRQHAYATGDSTEHFCTNGRQRGALVSILAGTVSRSSTKVFLEGDSLSARFNGSLNNSALIEGLRSARAVPAIASDGIS
jgi:hypothetical protein